MRLVRRGRSSVCRGDMSNYTTVVFYNIMYTVVCANTYSVDKGTAAGHDSHLTVSDINYRRYRGGGLPSTTLFAHHGNETTHRRRAESSNILTPFWPRRIAIFYNMHYSFQKTIPNIKQKSITYTNPYNPYVLCEKHTHTHT